MNRFAIPVIGTLLIIGIGIAVAIARPLDSFRGFQGCTAEAKICPDGSAVGRSGPQCQFAECSTELKGYSDALFTFEHPAGFLIDGETGGPGIFFGETHVRGHFPFGALNSMGTNFNGAYFVVSTGETTESVCKTFSDLENRLTPDTGSVIINGREYKTQAAVEAAAGNRYATELFRTYDNGRCVELSLTVHTGAIENYSEGAVHEFDARTAFDALEKIAQTFRIK